MPATNPRDRDRTAPTRSILIFVGQCERGSTVTGAPSFSYQSTNTPIPS